MIRVRRTCSCGETLACQATLEGATLRLDVRFDPSSATFCDDCYGTSTHCPLPALPASTTVRVVADGDQLLGTWATDATGWPVGQACK